MQLIDEFHQEFARQSLPLRLTTYAIIPITSRSGAKRERERGREGERGRERERERQREREGERQRESTHPRNRAWMSTAAACASSASLSK